MKIRLEILLILFILILTGCSANQPPWTDEGVRKIETEIQHPIRPNCISDDGSRYVDVRFDTNVTFYSMVTGEKLAHFVSNNEYGLYYLEENLIWLNDDTFAFTAGDVQQAKSNNRIVLLKLKSDGTIQPLTKVWPESGPIGIAPMPIGFNQVLVQTQDELIVFDEKLNAVDEKWIGNKRKAVVITKNGQIYLSAFVPTDKEKTEIMTYRPGSGEEIQLIAELKGGYYLRDVSPAGDSLLVDTNIVNSDSTSEYIVLDTQTLNVKKRFSALLDVYIRFDLHGKHRGWVIDDYQYADFDWETMTFVPIDLPANKMKYFPKFGGFATAKYDEMGSLQFTKYP